MNNNESLDNEKFIDEIHENDIIVTQKKKKKKVCILLIIIILGLLLFLSLFLLYKNGIIIFNNTYHISNNLFVVHPNSNFGSEVEDFSNFNSYDNAYSYIFSVHNSSANELHYNITLLDLNHDNDYNVNKTQINYALLKNSELLFKGNLSDIEENILVQQKIFSNEVENYELRLWSNNNILGSLEFKIIVEK